VPSSTSSSRPNAPDGPWGRTWTLALVSALALMISYDLAWRSRGHRSWPGNDNDLWSLARSSIGPESVIVLGASRTLAGVDPAVLAERLGKPVAQLSINGASPLPILEHLAADESCQNTVIVGVAPGVVFDSARRSERSARLQLDAYERFVSSPSAQSEARLSSQLCRVTVTRSPRLSLLNVARCCLSGRSPRVTYGNRRADRMMTLDFSRTDARKLEEEMLLRLTRREQKTRGSNISMIAARLRPAVRRIVGRGGAVVFVRMPSAGRVRAAERHWYPRAGNWDMLAAEHPAGALHFEDYADLSPFSPPDGSHLDQKDAASFTVRLSRILRELFLRHLEQTSKEHQKTAGPGPSTKR